MVRITGIFMIIFSLLFTGCGNNGQTSKENEIEFTKLTSNHSTEQQISNQVKDNLKKREEITSIHAVNTTKQLVVAFEVTQFNRFSLAKINKKIKKKLEKNFPKLEITTSTDKKIIIEIKKLEDKLKTGSISEDALNKQVKKIKDLSKEET